MSEDEEVVETLPGRRPRAFGVSDLTGLGKMALGWIWYQAKLVSDNFLCAIPYATLAAKVRYMVSRAKDQTWSVCHLGSFGVPNCGEIASLEVDAALSRPGTLNFKLYSYDSSALLRVLSKTYSRNAQGICQFRFPFCGLNEVLS